MKSVENYVCSLLAQSRTDTVRRQFGHLCTAEQLQCLSVSIYEACSITFIQFINRHNMNQWEVWIK